MNRAHDKDVENTEPPASEPAGKVEFDSRGNSVWRWARDVLESTSVLLKRLENKDLALFRSVKGDGYTVMDKYLAGLDPTKKIDWNNPQANINTLTAK